MATETPSKPTGTSSRRKLTPPEYARQLGVCSAKVLAWIRNGELRAIDASTHRGNKPRFLIDVADIAVFEAARAAGPQPKVTRCRRRRQWDVEEIF
jgi:hypothetical protein